MNQDGLIGRLVNEIGQTSHQLSMVLLLLLMMMMMRTKKIATKMTSQDYFNQSINQSINQ